MENIVLRVNGIKYPGKPEEEVMEFVTEGKMYEKGGSIFIIYEETELSGLEGSVTTLKLKEDKVSLIRFGEDKKLSSRMEFEEGKPYSGYYSTPIGVLEFKIDTIRVRNEVTMKDGGYLGIDYNMNLVGLSDGRNILSMKVMKRGN